MRQFLKLSSNLCTVAALAIVSSASAGQSDPAASLRARNSNAVPGSLWHDPGNIAALDLFYGPGGKAHEPVGKYKFVEEDKKGTSPKFYAEDDRGVRWKVKLGQEVKSETAATRLMWAVGYFVDEDYYLPDLHVDGLPKLARGASFESADGVVHGVRMERKLKGEKKIGNWSWFDNPFLGTKEFNGMRVMMALLNNWDLKQINNDIYEEKGKEARYVVSDLGATFGKTGNSLTRSKGKLRDYQATHFIQKVKAGRVDFYMSSRPFFISVFNFPNYRTRTHMQAVAKNIPLKDAKWLGQLLGQLSPQQLHECFRAAGYSPDEIEGFSKVVQQRIADLNKL